MEIYVPCSQCDGAIRISVARNIVTEKETEEKITFLSAQWQTSFCSCGNEIRFQKVLNIGYFESYNNP